MNITRTERQTQIENLENRARLIQVLQVNPFRRGNAVLVRQLDRQLAATWHQIDQLRRLS